MGSMSGPPVAGITKSMLGVVSRVLWRWCNVLILLFPHRHFYTFPDDSFGPLLSSAPPQRSPGVWMGIELEVQRLGTV